MPADCLKPWRPPARAAWPSKEGRFLPASLSAAPRRVLVTVDRGRETPGFGARFWRGSAASGAESSHTLTSHPSHTTSKACRSPWRWLNFPGVPQQPVWHALASDPAYWDQLLAGFVVTSPCTANAYMPEYRDFLRRPRPPSIITSLKATLQRRAWHDRAGQGMTGAAGALQTPGETPPLWLLHLA